MNKRWFSLLLALCMAMSLIPSSVIAEEIEASVCTCQSACTAESRDGDCPVCGSESATEADCALYAAPESEAEPELSAAERVQALIDALPAAAEVADMTEAERDEVYADAEEAYAAFEALESAEEMAAITGLEKLSALMDALTAPAETYASSTLLLGDIDVIANPTGDGYSYRNGVLTLTDYDNNNVYSSDWRTLGNRNGYTTLYCIGDLTIKLVGTNKLTIPADKMKLNPTAAGTEAGKELYSGIFVDGALTIQTAEGATGQGKLIATAGHGAIQCATLTINNAELDLTAYRDCVYCSNADIRGGSKVKAVSSGDNMNYRAFRAAYEYGTSLHVSGASTLTAETHGYGCTIHYSSGDRYEQPCGIDAEGKILVTGNSVVIGKSLNSTAGKDDADCEGYGVRCGSLEINGGGRLEGHSEGKKGESPSGADGVYVKGELMLQGSATVIGETNCNTDVTGKNYYEYGGIRVGSLPETMMSNGTEVSRCHITTPYLGRVIETGGANYIGNSSEMRAKKATIRGIMDCTLKLSQTTGGLTYGYYDTSSGATYADTLDLTKTNTVGIGDAATVVTRVSDPLLIRGIVVEKGNHKIKIPSGFYANIYDTYITVKSGATLDLVLTGSTVFWDRRTTGTGVSAPIVVEPGGTLNILNGSSSTFASLSITSSVAPGIEGCTTDAGYVYGTVSVEKCILLVRGVEKQIWDEDVRFDILTNLTIKDRAYVDANFGIDDAIPTLTMTGGTLVGRVGETSGGKTTIYYSGIGNLQLENADAVKVLDATTGVELYPVEVTLYDEYGLFDEQTYTANIRVLNEDTTELKEWRMRLVSSLTIARSANLSAGAQEEAGEIPLHLTGAATEKQNCKLTLYLKAGDLVTKAKITGPATSNTVSYWTSAAAAQQIIAAADTTAKGALYTVGHLLMDGVMSLRGAEPADPNADAVLQVCPDSKAAETENPYWIDYENMGYKTFKLNTPEGYSSVTGYTLRVESNQHKIILDGLTLRPDPDTSCIELVGVPTGSTTGKVESPQLTVALLDGKTNILSNRDNPIFNMQSDPTAMAGNTLEFMGVTDGGESYDLAVGGKLTLQGGKAFDNTQNSDLVFKSAFVDNQCDYENDPNNSHTFRNLTFKNSTVIGMGRVKADSITIDGGSVDITPIENTPVKNSAGTPLTKDTLTFPSGCDGKQVTDLTLGGLGGNSFDTSNITTDGSGRINLWLPEDAYVISAKVDGKLYYAMENEDGGYDFVDGTAPRFITPAANTTLIFNGGMALSANATGAPRPTLTWQVDKGDGNGWSNVVEGFETDGKFYMTAERNGWKLRCVATNTYVDEQGNAQTGTATSPVYTMYYLPKVDTTKLLDQTVKTGETATFSVNMTAATPAGLTARYQWQRLVGETWTDIENATGTTYAPTVTMEMDGWKLRYQVTYTAADGTGKTVTSADLIEFSDGRRKMTLTVVDAPKITQQPKNAAVSNALLPGSSLSKTAAFTVKIDSTMVGTPDYLWQVSKDSGVTWEALNAGVCNGNYENTLIVTVNNTQMDGWQYRCAVSNTRGSVKNTIYSSVATITVVGMPVITTPPVPTTVKAGESASFSIAATGNHTLSYQWQVKTASADWANISGATTSRYSVTASAAMDGWKYRCIVTNSSGDVSISSENYSSTMDGVVLTVVDAPKIMQQPVNVATLPDGSVSFTVAATGNQTLRYQWQVKTGSADWSDIAGANGTGYTVSGAALALNGAQYRCAVTNSANSVDNTVYSAAATLAVVGQPVITQQPKDDIAHLRGSAHFTVAATGNQTLRYQWQVSEDDGASWRDIAGATDAGCTLSGLRQEMTGWKYRCVVTNFSGDVSQSVTSEAATLTTIDPPGATEKGDSVTVTESEHGDSTIIRNGDDSTATVTPKPDKGYRVVEVIAEDEDGNRLEVKDNGDGRYIIDVPEGGKVTVKVIYAEDEGGSGFLDVPEGKYFYDAVNWAVANGITGGVDATHFDPYAPCTRGQLVTFLWRAAGQPAAKNANAFSDVAAGRYCEKAVAWAAENEIVGGYDDGTFRPDATVTRQQTAAILWRFAKYAGMDVSVGEDTNILSFSDALSISDYAFPAIQWAVGAGVMGGSEDKLLPRGICNRAQIVTMLYRCIKK